RVAGAARDRRHVPREPRQRHEALVERPLPVDAARRAERLGTRPLLDRVLLQPEPRRAHRGAADVYGPCQPAPLRAGGVTRPRAAVLQRQLLPPAGIYRLKVGAPIWPPTPPNVRSAPAKPWRSSVLLAAEPVAQRLDGGAGLDERVAHGGHDLLGARAVAVDADGVDPRVDHLAGDRADLAL